MVCRHRAGDPDCSKNGGGYVREQADYSRQLYEKKLKELENATPDASRYGVERAEQVGKHLVMEVSYPNCAKCSYEGKKVMVFLDTTAMQALKWKKIDPHFRSPDAGWKETESPSPAARFPASADGWADALAYAKSKV